jgi:hypothetical protein
MKAFLFERRPQKRSATPVSAVSNIAVPLKASFEATFFSSPVKRRRVQFLADMYHSARRGESTAHINHFRTNGAVACSTSPRMQRFLAKRPI